MTLPALESERALRETLKLLDADRFEELVYSIVCLKWPDAVRLRPPDGGADSLLEREFGGPRVWQAKHFSGNISWPQCVKSLKKAVERWQPERVTFVFGKELTEGQQKLFREKLAADSVVLDWWGTSELLRRMLESEEGKRVARRFLDLGTDMALAVRAQGELSRGAHVVDRVAAAAQAADGMDPDYRYTFTHDTPHDDVLPATGLRLEKVTTGQRSIIDAFPRIPGSLPAPPGGAIKFDDSPEGAAAAAKFREALSSHTGGTVDLSGAAALEFRGLPVVFQDILNEADLRKASVTVSRSSWPARWLVAGPRGIHKLDLDFRGAAPGELRAERGGLVVTATLADKNLDIQWTYSTRGLPPSSELETVTFIQALLQGGTVQLEDRRDRVKPLSLNVAGRGPDPFIDELARYLDCLRSIETYLGADLGVGEQEFSDGEVRNVAAAAAALDQGGRELKLEEVRATTAVLTGDVTREVVVELFESGQLVLTQTLKDEFTIRGRSISLGAYAIPVPRGSVSSFTPNDDGTANVVFAPDPATSAIWATLQPPSYQLGGPVKIRKTPFGAPTREVASHPAAEDST